MTKNLAVHQAASASAAAAEVEKQGLHLPTRPQYERSDDGPPSVPLRLSEENDDNLMRLFVALTRWTDYLAGQVAMAEVDLRALEAVLSTAENTVLLRDWTGAKEDRVTIAKAERANDPVVQEWRQKVDTAWAYRKLMLVIYESTERDAALCSRELSRRTGRESIERRADRWGGGR